MGEVWLLRWVGGYSIAASLYCYGYGGWRAAEAQLCNEVGDGDEADLLRQAERGSAFRAHDPQDFK